jgi:hypothetical protein
MNPHVRKALWAAAGTAILLVAFMIQVRIPSRSILVDIVSALVMPGWLVAAALRLGGGTDGGTNALYAFPFTFAIYWLLFELVSVVWRVLIRSRIGDRDERLS